jgi:hypothetical protein
MAHFIMSSAPRPRRSANPFQAFLGVSYAARGTDNLILPLHDKASPPLFPLLIVCILGIMSSRFEALRHQVTTYCELI